MPVTGFIGIFKDVPSCFNCRSFKARISLHFRRMQACFFLPGPPNFTMSKQYLHCPQSFLVQAKQLPHRPRFLSPTYIKFSAILIIIVYIYTWFLNRALFLFDYKLFCHITIEIFNIRLLSISTITTCILTPLCRGSVSCFSIMWTSVPQ